MDILDDMGVSKLSAKVFSKVNYSFKCKGRGYSSYSSPKNNRSPSSCRYKPMHDFLS